MSFNLLLQYLLPHYILSRLLGKIANCRISIIKNCIINQYCKFYHIDLSEALETNHSNYHSFNDFFTRALKPGVRPIIDDPQLITSPVDGKIWQIGEVGNNQIIAKGKGFTLEQLLADTQEASQFCDASFAVLYLAPNNYHRVHMPVNGKLNSMRYVPGQLFSVSPKVVNHIPNVFAKNERVIAIFNTVLGPVAVIFIGAMIVGSIETRWGGSIVPNNLKTPTDWHYGEQDLSFERGEEIGKFKLGSTIILLFPKGTIKWDEQLQQDTPIKMGQRLGKMV